MNFEYLINHNANSIPHVTILETIRKLFIKNPHAVIDPKELFHEIGNVPVEQHEWTNGLQAYHVSIYSGIYAIAVPISTNL